MILTNENYFSKEASLKFAGVSQFKSFDECPAMAMAEINGTHEREKTPALLVGSYVDSHFEETLDILGRKIHRYSRRMVLLNQITYKPSR